MIAVSTVCFGDQWSTADIAAAAHDAKFSGLELTPERVHEAATCLAEYGQAAVTVGALQNFAGGDAAKVAARAANAQHFIGLAAEVGAQAILTCLPMDCRTDPAMAVERLRWMLGAIERRRWPDSPPPEIWAEALSWGLDYNRIDHARKVVQAVGDHRVKVVVDSAHLFARGELRDLELINPACIGLVQICDLPREPEDGPDAKLLCRDFRLPPGRGVWARQNKALMSWLYSHGYDGPVSLEVFSAASRERKPRDVAADLMAAALQVGVRL